MAIRMGYNVAYRWQGISLHCWMTALEMLMHWRYGCIYGVDPGTGANRVAHTAQVQTAKARNRGFAPGAIEGYGLQQVLRNDISAQIDGWREALRHRGPILASGTYGPARIVGGHVVLIVGISGSNKVVYLDPFLIGMKAIAGNHATYVSPADCFARLAKPYGVNQLFQAASGGADAGFGWP
ncbi:papain-like cysteine protease family protein [Roseomonas sp. F4]